MMKRFQLVRAVDVTGVSGTGIVAEGIEFSDGTAVVRWVVGEYRSTVIWPTGTDAVVAVHGHGGATTVRWLDEDPIMPESGVYYANGGAITDQGDLRDALLRVTERPDAG